MVFKFPVLKQASKAIDWRRVELTNWAQLVGRECGLTVRKNTGSLEIFCDVVYGQDSYGLLFDAFYEACWLEWLFHFRF